MSERLVEVRNVTLGHFEVDEDHKAVAALLVSPDGVRILVSDSKGKPVILSPKVVEAVVGKVNQLRQAAEATPEQTV